MEAVALAACAFDRDCPAGQLCYVNVSWAPPGAPDGFCECNAFYGWSGQPSCDTFSVGTYVLIAQACAQALVCIILGLMGVVDVARTVQAFGPRLTSAFVTALATTVALLCHFAYRVLFVLSAAIPAENNRFLSDAADAEKFTTFSVIHRPFLFVVCVLAVVACLNVSVMWVELAYRAKAMMTRMISSVTHYRRLVIGIEALFTIMMAVMAVLGRFDLAVVAAMPVLLVLAVFFTLGRIRMVRVLRTAISMDGSTPSKSSRSKVRGEKSSVERTRRTMVVIKKVSLHVILALFGIIAAGAAYFVFNSRSNTKSGAFPWLALIAESLPLFLLYTLAAVFYYSHRSTNKILRRHYGLTQGAISSSSHGSKEERTFTHTNTLANPTSSTFEERVKTFVGVDGEDDFV